MQIRRALVRVDDQDKASAFYTSKLGFVKKLGTPVGERWLTVVSPEGAQGVEIVLETDGFPVVRQTKRLLYDTGFPATVFFGDTCGTIINVQQPNGSGEA